MQTYKNDKAKQVSSTERLQSQNIPLLQKMLEVVLRVVLFVPSLSDRLNERQLISQYKLLND